MLDDDDEIADALRPALPVAGHAQDLDLVLDNPLDDMARPGDPVLDAQAGPAQLVARLDRGAGLGRAAGAEPECGI